MVSQGAQAKSQDAEPLQHWRTLLPLLNESQKRLYVAEKAISLGRGGVSYLSRLTGISRTTITKGIGELQSGIDSEQATSIRRGGGGRKPLEQTDPALKEALETMMEENTAGDPMSCLKWTGKSVRKLSQELERLGHPSSPNTVRRLLQDMDYSLRANVKTEEGAQHRDRDAQFRYINSQVKAFMKASEPVISVDTKKKELVGNFKNAGRTWRREAKRVNVHDFPSQGQGKAIPYGIYDVQQDVGLVNVGISHDTAEFAVHSISRWWRTLGRHEYEQAKRLLICADSGGSNASRNRLWKVALQEFVQEFNLEVTVLHYPPGTSKWNKIEHKMFSFISINWKGEPLISYETVINLISTTRTKSGLKLIAKLDKKNYQTGKKITDQQMQSLNIQRHKKQPQWNYTIAPQSIT